MGIGLDALGCGDNSARMRAIEISDPPMTCPALPLELYTAASVRELDRLAIEGFGIPGLQLMKRAARAAFAVLRERWPRPEHLHVFCGTGNNGGDGFIVAALARQRGLAVTVWQVGAAAKIGGDALQARRLAEREQVDILEFDGSVPRIGIVVDALLGTGLTGDVRAPFLGAIEAINSSGLPVLALDIPSGLCSDTGRVLGSAVVASATVSFIGLKRGLFTGAAADHCGDIRFAGLDVPAQLFERVPADARRLVLESTLQALAPRPRIAHKGFYGHVLVVGGDHGMAGAAGLAARAAARLGAGLVSCATRPEHIAALVALCPEVMAHGVRGRGDLEPLLERATTVVIGPGLGRGAWGGQLLQCVLQFAAAGSVRLVVDADALNMLAEQSPGPATSNSQWVLTPHPGEAARLLGCQSAEIQRDRFSAAAALQRRYGGAVILKGSGSLVATAAGTGIAGYGNPGMASGGMGDVLSGVLGGLLAQGLSVEAAAELGACLHGAAADRAALDGERGLLASDLLPHLRALANGVAQ
jgi:NAD(P)H-hydrate epimerase